MDIKNTSDLLLAGTPNLHKAANMSTAEAVENYNNKSAAYSAKEKAYQEACKNYTEGAGADYKRAASKLVEAYDRRDTAAIEKAQAEQRKANLAEAEADQKRLAAEEELEAAQKDLEEAERMLLVKQMKEENARPEDQTCVVHKAIIFCKYGRRVSEVGVTVSHGVYIKETPQLTVADTELDINLINFGGCKSPDNPSTKAMAKSIMEEAGKEIAENTKWYDSAANAAAKAVLGAGGISLALECFLSQKEDEMDALLELCMGECIPDFVSDTWMNGHEKVKINDSEIMLRRCELTCKYGGLVILQTSGQLE